MHRMPNTPGAPKPGNTKISRAIRTNPSMKSKSASTNISPLNRDCAQNTRMKHNAAMMPGTVSPGTLSSRISQRSSPAPPGWVSRGVRLVELAK